MFGNDKNTAATGTGLPPVSEGPVNDPVEGLGHAPYAEESKPSEETPPGEPAEAPKEAPEEAPDAPPDDAPEEEASESDDEKEAQEERDVTTPAEENVVETSSTVGGAIVMKNVPAEPDPINKPLLIEALEAVLELAVTQSAKNIDAAKASVEALKG